MLNAPVSLGEKVKFIRAKQLPDGGGHEIQHGEGTVVSLHLNQDKRPMAMVKTAANEAYNIDWAFLNPGEAQVEALNKGAAQVEYLTQQATQEVNSLTREWNKRIDEAYTEFLGAPLEIENYDEQPREDAQDAALAGAEPAAGVEGDDSQG